MARPLPDRGEKAARKERRRPKRPRTPGQDVAERSRIWQALLESEDRYRATFDCAPIGIMHSSVESDRILHANPKLTEMLGYTELELLGMTADDILHPDYVGADPPRYREKMLSGELGSFSSEGKYVRKDRSVIWVNRTVSLARDPLGAPLYFIRIMEDITGRKQAEANLERLMRARRVMAECNRVQTHAQVETTMLEEMCRAVVESGGYKMAWVGLATGDSEHPVRVAAHAGFGGDSPMSGSVAWSVDGRHQGFMDAVIATGHPHIARDILGDPAQSRRRAQAELHGFQSSIALPLRKDGDPLGAVAIYAREPDAFDSNEISLLTGLADDIAFGIASLRERLARQNAEAAQRESEQRLSLALEGSGQALFDWNVVTGEVFLSPRWNDMVGGDRGTVLTTFDELARLVHPDDVDQLKASIVESLKGDTPYRTEHRIRNRAGDWIWIQSHGKVTARDARGRALRLAGYNTDVTPRKLAELALAASEERFRATFDQAAVGIFHANLNGRYLRVNRKLCEITGYTEEELTSASHPRLSHPDDVESGSDDRAKLIAGEISSHSNEKRYVHKDGRVIWVNRTESLARDEAGNPLYLIRVIEDITERKRTEESVIHERMLLRAIIDTVPDYIYVKDAEGRFQLANRAWLKERNLSDNSIAGKTVFDVFSAALAQRMADQDAEIVRTGVPIRDFEQKVILKTPEGEVAHPQWFSISKVPMQDASGRIIGTVGTSRDITERKLLEQSREMEHTVTRMLADAASVDEAMPNLIKTMCEAMGWAYGSRWHWSAAEQTLVRKEFWSDFVMDFGGEDTVPWTRLRFRNPRGPVSRAWHENQPTWIEDMRCNDTINRRHTALKLGLHSAFVFPVMGGGKTIGIMEFFGRETRRPDELLLEIAGSIGRQIGQFIQRKEAEQALRASEERYRDVFDASPLPMWIWDDESLDIVAVNHAATVHYGYSRDEFLRMNVRDFWLPDEATRYEWNIRSRAQKTLLQLQRRHRTKDGRTIDTEVTARLFKLGGRSVWLTVINDVSERVIAEAALRESEEQFRQLAGNIPQVFWITDTANRQTLYVSPAAETMLGRPLQDILADRRALIRAVHKEDRARVYAARKTAMESGYDETYRIVRGDGSMRWVQDRAFPVRDAEGRIYRIAGIAEDVTDRKQAEERLEHLAHYDTLTNLPNRALFYDRLKQTLAQARRNRWTMGVMFIDADRFKNVNDTLGHAVGDQLLQQIARRLTQSVRSDDTVGRLGGDEFAIVLSTLASAQDATLVAQKIMATFTEPYKLEGAEVYITVSIGITLFPDDSNDHDVLIKNADTAMYRAKEIGRNSYQFYRPEMNERAIELLGMESSLRRALERNEFLLHYQPKASVADGDITGLEALLRWKHPERGLVSPTNFIPLLEDSGLIVPVGEWVLNAVCSQVKAWERAGDRPVPVSVNLSARQFAARDLGPTIKRILEEHQVDPGLIELEITESSLMANTEEAVRTLEYLDRLGVGLAIDDFGTGYSSLGYLKRFPISALKIDHSFVHDVTTDGDDATITRAIISMAHSLGLKVIAEGVETRAQLEFLAEYGCNEIQGYYFARPLAAEDCSTWIREQRRLERPGPASDVSVPVVLVLDDDDETLAHFGRTLAKDGYRILAARNAREGLELLRDHRVDVVVSDQYMPGMTGVDFLQCVQTLSPKTMRILTTGHADFQTMADAVNRGGIFRCLAKDLGDDALRDNVRQAVQARIQALENSIPPWALRK